MLKKTIEYTDYNGNKRTKECRFNISKVELMQMELSTKGGLSEELKRVTEANDAAKVIEFFKNLILKAYGEKSEDGDRFIKSEAMSEAFSQTEAFDVLFMELITNADAAANFVKGVIPNDIDAAFTPAK